MMMVCVYNKKPPAVSKTIIIPNYSTNKQKLQTAAKQNQPGQSTTTTTKPIVCGDDEYD